MRRLTAAAVREDGIEIVIGGQVVFGWYPGFDNVLLSQDAERCHSAYSHLEDAFNWLEKIVCPEEEDTRLPYREEEVAPCFLEGAEKIREARRKKRAAQVVEQIARMNDANFRSQPRNSEEREVRDRINYIRQNLSGISPEDARQILQAVVKFLGESTPRVSYP